MTLVDAFYSSCSTSEKSLINEGDSVLALQLCSELFYPPSCNNAEILFVLFFRNSTAQDQDDVEELMSLPNTF